MPNRQENDSEQQIKPFQAYWIMIPHLNTGCWQKLDNDEKLKHIQAVFPKYAPEDNAETRTMVADCKKRPCMVIGIKGNEVVCILGFSRRNKWHHMKSPVPFCGEKKSYIDPNHLRRLPIKFIDGPAKPLSRTEQEKFRYAIHRSNFSTISGSSSNTPQSQ